MHGASTPTEKQGQIKQIAIQNTRRDLIDPRFLPVWLCKACHFSWSSRNMVFRLRHAFLYFETNSCKGSSPSIEGNGSDFFPLGLAGVSVLSSPPPSSISIKSPSPKSKPSEKAPTPLMSSSSSRIFSLPCLGGSKFGLRMAEQRPFEKQKYQEPLNFKRKPCTCSIQVAQPCLKSKQGISVSSRKGTVWSTSSPCSAPQHL